MGQTTTVVRCGDGRPVRVSLWYPARSWGRDQPFAAEAAPSPAVVFGHAYLAAPTLYDSTLRHLATHGMVVAAPESERRPFPSHAALAGDLSRTVSWLAAGAGGSGAGALPGTVDPERIALAGHSMGGGCAILAAAADAGLVRSVCTLAAARTRPSAVRAAGRLRAPTQFVAAERDAITPVRRHQRPLFAAVPAGTPTQLRIIRGGSHGGFLDSVGPFAMRQPAGRALPRADQLDLVRELLVSWLLLTLSGRSELWDAVWGPTAAARTDIALECRSAPPRPATPGAQSRATES